MNLALRLWGVFSTLSGRSLVTLNFLYCCVITAPHLGRAQRRERTSLNGQVREQPGALARRTLVSQLICFC